MKAVVMAVQNMTVAFGNVLDVILVPSLVKLIGEQVSFYLITFHSSRFIVNINLISIHVLIILGIHFLLLCRIDAF